MRHSASYSLSIRLFSFIEALFHHAILELKDYDSGSPEYIASRWYDWMKKGSTVTEVGSNRGGFYKRVIEYAKQASLNLLKSSYIF